MSGWVLPQAWGIYIDTADWQVTHTQLKLGVVFSLNNVHIREPVCQPVESGKASAQSKAPRGEGEYPTCCKDD